MNTLSIHTTTTTTTTSPSTGYGIAWTKTTAFTPAGYNSIASANSFSTFYATSDQAGIIKSSDSGSTWQVIFPATNVTYWGGIAVSNKYMSYMCDV